MGGDHGGGMGDGPECVEDGDYVEIEVDLLNTGVLAEARGEAEWEMSASRVRFAVEIADVPTGSYLLRVGGANVGTIEVFEMHNGETYGHLGFRDPPVSGVNPLDFEPRGQKVEVLSDGALVYTGRILRQPASRRMPRQFPSLTLTIQGAHVVARTVFQTPLATP